MNENLQSLLEKINREGIAKADAEAQKIIAAAKAEAAALVKTAEEAAAKAKAEAEQASADYAARSAETIRQAARDTVLTVKSAVTALLTNLLTAEVGKALADERMVSELVASAIRSLPEGEIACGEKLARALAAQLASSGSFKVVTDGFTGAGFTVKVDGGRVEHSFTEAVIAEELAKRLRSELAKLVK